MLRRHGRNADVQLSAIPPSVDASVGLPAQPTGHEEMTPLSSLARSIETCYAVFSQYRQPRILHASPLRDPAEILKTLTAVHLRELTDGSIGPYAGYALTTVGDVDDYRHFLPRILELAVYSQTYPGMEPTMIAGKLRTGNWLEWPEDEQKGLQDFFSLAWHQAVHSDDFAADCIIWFRAMTMLNAHIGWALERWIASRHPNTKIQLANFIQSQTKAIFAEAGSARRDWESVDNTIIEDIRKWMLGEAVEESLTKACLTVQPMEIWKLESALANIEQQREPG